MVAPTKVKNMYPAWEKFKEIIRQCIAEQDALLHGGAHEPDEVDGVEIEIEIENEAPYEPQLDLFEPFMHEVGENEMEELYAFLDEEFPDLEKDWL
tara:strand:+ start:811 stop:1098 length:288 start_codon:yes stop_codon:yes gene_type:complete